MPELRQDPVTGRWVIISTERAKRPSDFRRQKDEEGPVQPDRKEKNCPFCPGNEKETPPEVFALRLAGTSADTPGWQVRVVPNKFPALTANGDGRKKTSGLYNSLDGIGVHEVIIEGPDHEVELREYKPDHAVRVLQTWRQRYLQHARDGRLAYVQIFKNYGTEAGASLRHPHSQLIATPVIPPDLQEEIRRAEEYMEREESCLYCDLLETELRQGARVVAFNKHFLAFCPFASRFPFETWIFPRQHQPSFGDLTDAQLEDLVSLLQDLLDRLAKTLADPPFNLIVRTAPLHQEVPTYHWHLQLLPRLTTVAGFEWGTNIYINPTSPEHAAQFLNDVNKEEQR
ncbi:MAG TPA: galactose-1-phosphate uridylyltransferase [Peptococcaceae bacterium]|nr:MAG: Galactose-1-phosphate uridylyltransferase [Moorella sp. 60_41]HBT47053.1 galactose-1-phosphate uridylyltransferase [Peptococcaceae bacterium]